MPVDTLARRMRIALAESDLKDQEVAELANVTPAWIGSVKQGIVKDPALDKIRAVARVLGKTAGYFTAPLGYIPIEEVEAGLLVSLNDEDRELLGRIAARMANRRAAAADPPVTASSRRRASS